MKTLNNTLIGTLIIVFTLFSCKKEVINGKDGLDGKDGVCDGKVEVYFTGSITDVEAEEKVKTEVGHLTQKIYVTNTSSLSNLNLSTVTELVELIIVNNSSLQSINISNIEEVTNNFLFNKNNKITTVNLTKLKRAGNFSIGESWYADTSIVSSINLSSLEEVLTLNISKTKITSLNLPLLKTALNGMNLYLNKELTSLYLPEILNCNQLGIEQNKLAQINLPKFKKGSIFVNYETNLTSVSFPSIIEFQNFVISGQTKLNSASINSLLSQFLTIRPLLTSSYINLSNQNPLAPPTGSAVSHKYTLISLGNNVYTD